MLNRERGEVRIIHEVAGRPYGHDELAQQRQVSRSGLHDHGRWLRQPGLDGGQRDIGRQGDGKIPAFVDRRMNASTATQAKPTTAPPDSASSSHSRDAAWRLLSVFTAYSRTLASTMFTIRSSSDA
jgi:hypothetical protein